jgi:hypothetical protein
MGTSLVLHIMTEHGHILNTQVEELTQTVWIVIHCQPRAIGAPNSADRSPTTCCTRRTRQAHESSAPVLLQVLAGGAANGAATSLSKRCATQGHQVR